MTARKRRKTAEERRIEADRLKRRRWKEFQEKVPQIHDLKEAMRYVNSGPRSGKPGGHLFSNLGFFLHHFALPDGAREEEIALYERLSRNFEAAGQLKAGTTARIFGAKR